MFFFFILYYDVSVNKGKVRLCSHKYAIYGFYSYFRYGIMAQLSRQKFNIFIMN